MKNLFLLLILILSNCLSLQAQVCTGDFVLNSQAAVDAFDCTSIVNGDLSIESNSITDLSGLSELTTIDGNLSIRNCSGLINLDGLENLTTISGDLLLFFAPNLTDFSALDGLTSVNEVSLRFLNGVTDLNLLNGLTSVGKLSIGNYTSLTNITGFNNLTSVATLEIMSTDNLQQVSGFNGLTTVNVINFNNNRNLLAVNGFSSLTSVEDFTVKTNNDLVDLSAFTGLSISNSITITGNISLEECQFAAPILVGNPGITNAIRDNSAVPGCCNSSSNIISPSCFFTCPTTSAIGNSLSFDGVDDYVNLDALVPALIGKDALSIEFWMKADVNDQVGPRTLMFAHNAPAGGDDKFLLLMEGPSTVQPGTIVIYDESLGNSSSFEFQSTDAVGDDEWHHILYSRTLTVNGDVVGTLYIDGVDNGSHVADNPFTPNDRISLGQDWDANVTTEFFNGNLAEVRIWDRSFTQAEVTASFDAGELSGIVDGLTAYYKFENNGASPAIIDCTPNGFDGSRIGANGTTNLPQFVADMPCIEDHACSELIVAELTITNTISDYAPTVNGNVLVTFEIEVLNSGSADLFDLEVYDDLVAQFGPAFVLSTTPVVTFITQPTSGALTANNLYDGSGVNILTDGQSLAAGETFTTSVQVELDVNQVSSGQSNTATITSNTVTGGGAASVAVDASSTVVMLSDCFAAVTGSLTCNPALQLSVSPDPESCFGIIDPTTLLEGEDAACFGPGAPLEGFFRITLTTSNGTIVAVSDADLDPATTDIIEADLSAHLNETLTFTITTTLSNPNSCSGTLLIEDTVAPELSGAAVFAADCLADLSTFSLPIVIDNCDQATGISLGNPSITMTPVNPCSAGGAIQIVTRTFIVQDASGNVSDPFTQTIFVTQVTPTFPADVVYSCEEFALDNSIVDATAAGAGVPNVFDVASGFGTCNFEVSVEEEIIDACGSTSGRFKILRTWTISNDCSNDPPLVQTQTISVTDSVDPVIGLPATVTLQANVAVTVGNNTCASTGLLPVPTLSDNCSGVDSSTLTVITPVGEATPVMAAGEIVGYQIPSPFLTLGGPHTVTYTVMDICGNTAAVDVLVSIEDNTPPVATCDEITTLSLTTTSTTALSAITIDDGSMDQCSPDVFFKVIRMDEAAGAPVACAGANVNSTLEAAANLVYFDDATLFCCDDIANNPIMVMLRVFDVDPGSGPVDPSRMELGGDLFGRFNECMAEVNVEDKLAPQLLCAAPQTVVCTDLATIQQYTDVNNTTFDAPFVIDACATTTTLAINDATSSCGNGMITRTFTITDNQGNASTCSQVISVVLEHNYSILWPNDVDVSLCQVGVFGDTLSRPNSLIENGCDLLAVSYVDRRFETQNSGCYKILRTYDVINWCEWDGASAAVGVPNPNTSVAGPRLDVTVSAAGNQSVLIDGQPLVSATSAPNQVTSVGRWSYTQFIKVYDSVDPVLSNVIAATCNPATPTPGVTCGQAVSVSFDLTDNCGNLYPVTYQLVEGAADTDGNGQISATELAQGNLLTSDPYGTITAPTGSTSSAALAGTFTITGNYPAGSYVAILDVRDLCGNVSELYVPFTSEDCKAPTPIGKSFVSIDLMATGMVPITAQSIDNGSFDACSAIFLSFSANTADTVKVFDCTTLGAQNVQLWVTDVAGNQDFINVVVNVFDNLNACGTVVVPRTIAGTIANPIGSNVQHVNVSATGGYFANMMTQANGQFEFFRINNGTNITVTPERLDAAYAGITTFDLYLIGQHILGINPFTSPEQLIAADVSNNGQVSAFDMTFIRRIILGLDTEFPNNTSWRFIDASYTFPDPANPWQEVFPESLEFDPLVQNMMNSDFTAIKVGDVNNSVQSNATQPLAPRTLTGEFTLDAQNAILSKGKMQTVAFNASDVSVLGYQLTLEWNPIDVEVVAINAGAHPASGFGKHLLQEGKLSMSHNGEMNGELFSIEIRALRDGVVLSEVFTSGSSITTAEAFAKTGEQSVNLRFNGEATSVANTLEQNRPNPFNGTTQINFTLAEAGEATFTVTDLTGRVVWQTAGHFDAGRSQIEIAAKDLPVIGLLNYTLIAGEFTATRKMVVVK